MTSKLTIEQAKRLRNDFECWQQDYDPKDDKEQYDMFGRGMVAMDMLIAGMYQEPVAYTDERNLGYIDRRRETAYLWGKQNSEASDVALYRHAQPAVDSDFIPKNLDKALGVVGVAIPESREEFNLQAERWIQRLIDRVIRYADEFQEQPAPVVPDKMTAIVKDEAEYVEGWNACRAAMLQELKKSAGTEATCRSNENALVLNTIKAPPALGSLPKIVEVQNTNSPVNDVTTGKPLTNGDSVTCKSLTSINPAPALVSLPKNAKSLTGNSPVIPDGSEHCPCCGKKLRRACSVEGCDGNHVAHGLCQKHYDMKRWEDPEQVERFREAGRRYRGKKKTTVATPQEPKP